MTKGEDKKTKTKMTIDEKEPQISNNKDQITPFSDVKNLERRRDYLRTTITAFKGRVGTKSTRSV